MSKSRCDKALALESAESEAPPAADSTPGDTNVPEPQPQGDPVETNTAAADTSSEDAANLNGWVRWLKVLLGELPRERDDDPVQRLDREAYTDALTDVGARHKVYRPFIEYVTVRPIVVDGETTHGFLNFDSCFENDPYSASIHLSATDVEAAQNTDDLEGLIQKKLGYKSAPVMSRQLEKDFAQAIESVYGVSQKDKAYPWVFHALIGGTLSVDAMMTEMAPKPVATATRMSPEDRAKAKAEREARLQAQREAATQSAPEAPPAEPPVETEQSNEVALPEPPAVLFDQDEADTEPDLAAPANEAEAEPEDNGDGSIDEDVIDAAFDSAVAAFLDSLEQSGVFDTLSDETIREKFAQILR